MDEIDIVIHLACISNDSSFELDPSLSKTINFDAFEPLVIAAKNAGVSRFLYSLQVLSMELAINQVKDHPLIPLTLYNKYKGLCEPILFKYDSKNFSTCILRPATVCGYGPRQGGCLRNILTNLAINTNVIRVFGGSQLRPNLHIKDYSDVCQLRHAPAEKLENKFSIVVMKICQS